MRFTGKTAIVTGASSGIGRAAAVQFAREGAAVALAARRAERLEETAREIQAAGGRALAVPTDVTDPAAVQALVDRTLAEFGRLDLLINNAGVGMGGMLADLDFARFEKVWRVNVVGPLLLVRACLPALRESRGVIANVASVVGVRPGPGMGGYAATKAALISLSSTLGQELRGSGVAVVCVLPVVTATEFFVGTAYEEALRQPPDKRPVWMRHLQSAEEAAAELLDAIHTRKPLAPFSSRGRLLVFLQRHAPWLLDRMFRR